MGSVVKGVTRKSWTHRTGCSMASVEASQGYDPIALAAATEKVVVDGNKRKYVQLGRALRFYGGTS